MTTQVPGDPPPDTAPESAARRSMLLAAVLLSVLSLFIGLQGVVVQHRSIVDKSEAIAEVYSAEVRQLDDGAFVPVVRYRYQLGDGIYRSDQLFSNPRRMDRAAAERFVQDYPEGATVIAYFDPEDPQKSFLRPALRFNSYLFTLLGVALLAIGFSLSRWQGRAGVPSRTSPVRIRAMSALASTAIWQLGGLLVWGHYFRLQPPPYGVAPVVVTVCYVLLGLVPLWLAVKFWRQSRQNRISGEAK